MPLLTAALALSAAAAPPASRTVVTVGGRVAPAWFVCDTLDAPMEVVASRPPGRPDTVRVTLFPKTAMAAPHAGDYRLGAGDPGAGNVYYPIKTADGRDAGNLHALNPGVFDPKTPVVLPPFSSVEISGARATCRLVPGTRFLGFTARRSVLVVRTAAGGWAYRAFDLAAAASTAAHLPSLDIETGRETRRRSGGAEWSFANRGFGYRVTVPAADAGVPAALTVTHGRRIVQSEPFLAYSVAP